MFEHGWRRALLVAGCLVATLPVLAQDDGGDGGLSVGPEGNGASGAVLDELRLIQERVDDLIARLEGGDGGAQDAGSRDAGDLERRVAHLERQLRAFAAREARGRIQMLRADLEAGADRQQILDRLEGVRGDFERVFTGGQTELDEQVLSRDVTTSFDALAEMLGGDEDPSGAFEEVSAQLDRLASGATGAGDEDGAADDGDTGDGAEAPEDGDAAADLEVLGPRMYAENCAACHQGDGEGVEGTYPPLAGNPFVTGDPAPVIDVVLHGRGGMPSFASLSDREIAAVITHERTAWDNDADPISAEMVAAIRGGGTLEDVEGGPSFRPGAAN